MHKPTETVDLTNDGVEMWTGLEDRHGCSNLLTNRQNKSKQYSEVKNETKAESCIVKNSKYPAARVGSD